MFAVEDRNPGGTVRGGDTDEDQVSASGIAHGLGDVDAVPDVALRAGGMPCSGGEQDIGAARRRHEAGAIIKVDPNGFGAEVGQRLRCGRLGVTGGGADVMAVLEEGGHELAQSSGRAADAAGFVHDTPPGYIVD
jgi:hypothetical protein